MLGLFVLGVLAGYIAVAYGVIRAIFRKAHNRALAWIGSCCVVAIFVLIPTWDGILGEWELVKLCEREGGIKIQKTVENVDGFQAQRIVLDERLLTKYGYQFVEAQHRKTGQAIKLTLGKNREILNSPITEMSARYIVRHDAHWNKAVLNVSVIGTEIIDSATGEVLATEKRFLNSGSWLQVKMSPILGEGSECPVKMPSYLDFIASVLKPSRVTLQ